MEKREVDSVARHYNATRKKISKWITVVAIVIGIYAFLYHSSVIAMPIALCIAFAVELIMFLGMKLFAKRFKDKYNDVELYNAVISEVYGHGPDGSFEKAKRKFPFNYKHLIVFVIACAIGPSILFVKNKMDNSITLKMKAAISTQYKKFDYIDHLNVMVDGKRIDTLCFFRTEDGALSMASLITFDEDDWFIFTNFGPIYDGFGNVYVDPHYRYMSDVYVCEDISQIPDNAYLTYEIEGLHLYIGDVAELSDYEGDVWYKVTMTGEKRGYELNALLTARYILASSVSEFDIHELAWVRDEWRFADYLCVYSTSENELNTAVFTKDENKDISGLYATYEGLKVGETYQYIDSEEKYIIGYAFYENELDVPKDSLYSEELYVNGRELWLGVVMVENVLSE